MTTMLETVARAITDTNDLPYSIRLVRLVDGEATYLLEMDYYTPEEFPSHSDALDRYVERRDKVRATAAIKALMEPSEAIIESGWKTSEAADREYISCTPRDLFRSMLQAALNERE